MLAQMIGESQNAEESDVCEVEPYYITYYLEGGTNFSNAPKVYTIFDNIVFGTPTKDNYSFDGWYTDANFTNSITSIPQGSTGDKKLYAKWIGDTYYVTLAQNAYTNDNTINDIFAIQYGAQMPQKAAPVRNNYKFIGYYDERDGGTRYYDINMKSVHDWDKAKSAPLFAQWIPDEAFPFELTTINTGAFSFKLSAAGTFYVDWGDGIIDVIKRDDTTETTYMHTYDTSGVYTIKFAGTATGYTYNEKVAAITFNVNSAAPRIASIAGSLGAIFGTVESPTVGGRQPSFYKTFINASKINSTIPEHLFDGISGNLVSYMFNETFSGCSSLTGSIPAGLFANLSGNLPNYALYKMFYKCSNLSGYIPPALFSGLSTTISSTNPMVNIFTNSGIDTECPTGMTQYMTGFENYFNGKVSCAEAVTYKITLNTDSGTFPTGVVAPTEYTNSDLPLTLPAPTRTGYEFGGWYDNAELTGDAITEIPSGTTGNKTYYAKWNDASCPANYFAPSDHPEMCFPHVLHIGDNTVYLKSEKQTTPSLNIGMGNDVFYANMTTTATPMNSATEQYLKIMYNDTVYYVCDDTTYNQ